jgi:uncharacterized protein YndB with AHSA1/START domain
MLRNLSMIQVEINATIKRPIEEVFEQLVDIPRYPEWMPDSSLLITCTKDSGGPVGIGTEYSDKTRLGTVHGEITEFKRPHKVVFHYTARKLGITVMEGWPGYKLERDGEAATRIRHKAEAQLYGPFKLMQPLVQRMAYNERRRTVDALKESLESARS